MMMLMVVMIADDADDVMVMVMMMIMMMMMMVMMMMMMMITMTSPKRGHTLCEPAQSKCMSTCHKRHQKSHFIRNLQEECRGPEGAP